MTSTSACTAVLIELISSSSSGDRASPPGGLGSHCGLVPQSKQADDAALELCSAASLADGSAPGRPVGAGALHAADFGFAVETAQAKLSLESPGGSKGRGKLCGTAELFGLADELTARTDSLPNSPPLQSLTVKSELRVVTSGLQSKQRTSCVWRHWEKHPTQVSAPHAWQCSAATRPPQPKREHRAHAGTHAAQRGQRALVSQRWPRLAGLRPRGHPKGPIPHGALPLMPWAGGAGP